MSGVIEEIIMEEIMEEKKAMAVRMLEDDNEFTIEQISKYSDLPLDVIKNLADKLQNAERQN